MGKFVIALYTGTGNTLYIAKHFEGAEIHFISEFISGEYTLPDDTEKLGILFPVYNGGYPYPIELFVNTILGKRDNSKLEYLFLINTSSTNTSPVNYNLERLLLANGISVSYASSLKFPSADLKKHHKPLSEMKTLAEANKRITKIERIVEDIANKEIRLPKYSPLSYISNAIARKYNKPTKVTDMTISDKCNGCMVCYRICPTGNIVVENGKARFQQECIKCYACYHKCPEKAISYKKKTIGQYAGLVETEELFRR